MTPRILEESDDDIIVKPPTQEEKAVAEAVQSQINFIKWAMTSKKITKEEFSRRIMNQILPIPNNSYNDDDCYASIQGKGLFHIILDCPQLDIETQYELINHLFKIGFMEYYSELFKNTDPEKVLTFVNYWMKMTNNLMDIVSTFEATKNAITWSDNFEPYTKLFKRIAQLRIIEIFKNKENPSLTSDQISIIDTFIKDTQPALFDYFRRNASSYDILKIVCSKHPDAEKKFAEKCIRSNDEINKKLKDTLKHQTNFNFFIPKKQGGLSSYTKPVIQLPMPSSSPEFF